MIKNIRGGLAAALAVLVPLTAIPAQAADPQTFKGEHAPTKHDWTLDGRDVDTLYFGMKNLQGEVTMHKKRLRFTTKTNQLQVRSRQNQTFEVPAEVRSRTVCWVVYPLSSRCRPV
ncbi:hypothetical protein [Streptomyces boluensis]|uniref:Htaa domain-containing protein n=1 Tax=Streptomyces boluensis TaxID=1775135 RepID=A0A964XIR3_9ACTN|nr:hypothetical protein [Streptomyces boluensis]NBE50514.1 hypothetical protein [Streptomyces boluensis]